MATIQRKKGNRSGYTTGACAAAAARAAALGLLEGRVPDQVACLLPNGQQVQFSVAEGCLGERLQDEPLTCTGTVAHAVIIKDAGDDPDVTHRAAMSADLRPLPDQPNRVVLKGGEGVGVVTKLGLGLEIGAPAINPVPRANIEENVRAVAAPYLEKCGIEVTISVPGGDELAKRTLNPRLGIVGGISILGTSGIVHAYSTSAFRASVEQHIEVAAKQGLSTMVLTTGGRTERFTQAQLPHLHEACFVQMGDFLQPALEAVVKAGIPHVVIGGMVGKLMKMAQGERNTHAGRNPVNMGLVAQIAAEVGAPAAVCDEIRRAETARFASDCMAELGLSLPFYDNLAQRVVQTLTQRYAGRFTLRILVCDFEGNKVTEAQGGYHG
ncbi:cobalamin biosynthesis protein CbiD [Magnetococcus marinus MC-1]|uniref:Cobalt-precorrin-5B C(1)-methyltransferase n=1 Tax=Magnetococcus marinus (strain ATCC BAA-1437 / JCM 17883 / MC-1) TaxID=156889 RepID=A0LCD0_MAGMM|nr:cobalt-precorrin-5B (C(1))-methyltransferase [Magnetococcus marinus]ABK45623.1 cobalamin biosynthesis protein CbiD [Magnetococcus marinus MC-1]